MKIVKFTNKFFSVHYRWFKQKIKDVISFIINLITLLMKKLITYIIPLRLMKKL